MSIVAFDQPLEALLTSSHNGVLTTIKRDGRPQLSNVTYLYDPAPRTAIISVTADRAKTKNLQRDPRASLYVPGANFWSYGVAEADSELGPVAQAVDDESVESLVRYYRAVRGEHPDWDEYRQVMVTERRVLLTLHITRLYGLVN